jgi:hypothetical protein
MSPLHLGMSDKRQALGTSRRSDEHGCRSWHARQARPQPHALHGCGRACPCGLTKGPGCTLPDTGWWRAARLTPPDTGATGSCHATRHGWHGLGPRHPTRVPRGGRPKLKRSRSEKSSTAMTAEMHVTKTSITTADSTGKSAAAGHGGGGQGEEATPSSTLMKRLHVGSAWMMAGTTARRAEQEGGKEGERAGL